MLIDLLEKSVGDAGWAFSTALSSLPSNAALARAYLVADKARFLPPTWSIPTIFVPAKARRAVDAGSAVAGINESIVHARRLLDRVEFRLEWSYEKAIEFSKSSDEYHSPYYLAIALLDEYERYIEKTMFRHLTAYRKLALINKKARKLDRDCQLVRGAMPFSWR